MKRRLDCAWCGRALPAGCRIDKRYCDQRCVELAYYDRHPDKRAQKLAKLRRPRTTTGLRTRRTESAPDLVERMEAAHASTRQELEAVRERLAHLEAFLRSQSRAGQEQGQPHRAAQDAAAVRKVAELQEALHVERDRAEQAEREQATLQQQLAELSSSARELAIAREATRKAEQRSHDLEAALKQMQTGSTRPVSREQDPAQTSALQAERKAVSNLKDKLQAMAERAVQAEHAQKAAERQASELRRAVASWQTHSETQAHQLAEAQGALRTAEQNAASAQIQPHEDSAARLPWTIPSPDYAHRYIPRWEAWDASELDNLPELTDAALVEIPSQLWKNGERKLSQTMRGWIDTFSRETHTFSQQMYLRILCTPPSERRSKKQKAVLGEAILADSLRYLRRHQPELASEFERASESDWESYELLARELVIACAGRTLIRGYS